MAREIPNPAASTVMSSRLRNQTNANNACRKQVNALAFFPALSYMDGLPVSPTAA